MISGRTIWVDYGDWDMHAGMGNVDAGWMHDHLAELGQALVASSTDLGTSMSDVTFATLTEFGRRVEETAAAAPTMATASWFC